MAEEQKSQEDALDMDNFLGVEETPEKETPSQDGDSVESVTTEETPAAKPDSDDGTTEATEKQSEKETETPEKTPEQLKEDRAHWQSKYQDTKSELDQIREQYAKAWETDGEAPEATKDEEVNTLRDMLGKKGESTSDDDLKELLQDDPVLAMQVQGEFIKQVMRSERENWTREERAAEKKADQRAEEAAAQRVFNKWVQENDVPEQEWKAVVDDLKTAGIKGSPAAITDRIIKDITYNRIVSNAATKMKEVEAEVSQKVKTQALTRQPDAGGKDTEKTKSYEDILADKFGKSKAGNALSGLFG